MLVLFRNYIMVIVCYSLCLGFETPGEWEDHHRIFGVDGPNVQYTASSTPVSLYLCWLMNAF